MLRGIRGHPTTETTSAAYSVMGIDNANRFNCRHQMEVFISIEVSFDLAVSDTVVVVLYGVHWSERRLSSLTDEDEKCLLGVSVLVESVYQDSLMFTHSTHIQFSSYDRIDFSPFHYIQST